MSFTAGSSGGKYKIKLTESQLPKHTHNGSGGPLMIAGSGDRSQIGYGTNASYGETNGGTNCKNEEIDIMTPYQTIYRWKRVS